MSITQSKKLTDTEKKLQFLKTQLYGKEEQISTRSLQHSSEGSFHLNSAENPTISSRSSLSGLDTAYLKNDLLKICLLAALAISFQILLYISLQKGFIKLV